jgi:hypothetical protein
VRARGAVAQRARNGNETPDVVASLPVRWYEKHKQQQQQQQQARAGGAAAGNNTPATANAPGSANTAHPEKDDRAKPKERERERQERKATTQAYLEEGAMRRCIERRVTAIGLRF